MNDLIMKYGDTASALYDGGWRAEDRDWLIDEYELSEEEADAICKLLAYYAQEEIEDEH